MALMDVGKGVEHHDSHQEQFSTKCTFSISPRLGPIMPEDNLKKLLHDASSICLCVVDDK